MKSAISPFSSCQMYNVISFIYPKVNNLPKRRVFFIGLFLHTTIDFTSQYGFMTRFKGEKCSF